MPYYEEASLLSDPVVRRIFSKIVTERSIRLRDLRRFAAAKGQKKAQSISPDEVENALEKLEQTGLIDSKHSSVSSLNTYFVTSKGLEAKRKIDLG